MDAKLTILLETYLVVRIRGVVGVMMSIRMQHWFDWMSRRKWGGAGVVGGR